MAELPLDVRNFAVLNLASVEPTDRALAGWSMLSKFRWYAEGVAAEEETGIPQSFGREDLWHYLRSSLTGTRSNL